MDNKSKWRCYSISSFSSSILHSPVSIHYPSSSFSLSIHFIVPSSVALICRVCNSSSENCNYNPSSFEKCIQPNAGCFSRYSNETDHVRGCATPEHPEWQKCVQNAFIDCRWCHYDLCNSMPMRRPRYQTCITSKLSPVNTTGMIPQRCPGDIPNNIEDYCYQLLAENETTKRFYTLERGCFPYLGTITKTSIMFFCNRKGCNMYGHKSDRVCAVSTTESNLYCEKSFEGAPPYCINRLVGQLVVNSVLQVFCFSEFQNENQNLL